MLPILLGWVSLAGAAGIRDVWNSADIDRSLATGQTVHERPNWTIRVRRASKPTGVRRQEYDELAWVRKGRGKVIVDSKEFAVGTRDMVSLPRGVPHEWKPEGGELAWVSVQVMADGSGLAARGGFLAPRNMTPVLSRAEIESTIASNTSNQPLHSARNYTVNYVIYAGKEGPWELHKGCVDVYFLYTGTAQALLGGDIESAREESPGEVRGTGMRGSRAY